MINLHCHSSLSPDGECSMAEMAQAAQERGLQTLCFTDHYDLLDYDGNRISAAFPWEEAERDFAAAQAAAPAMELYLGVELGCPTQQPALAEAALRHSHIDFVIGSVHNPIAGPDYYFGSYHSAADCRAILDDYLLQLLELARSPYYDVLGHLDYPLRYMRRDGVDIELSPEAPLVREILRTVISTGRGIECNSSGYRNGGSSTFPGPALLALYRDLGGTILTLGSDAHNTAQIDLGLRESAAMLHGLGFRELTIYKNRTPKQIVLEKLT